MFLTLNDILTIHADMIESYGGTAGVLDMGKIESAIAQPSATFDGEFLHPDVFLMAAAYLFHLAKNHGFEDGNKRTALAAAIVFLKFNEIPFGPVPQEELAQLTEDVVCNRKSKEDVANYFRQHTVTENTEE